MNKICGIYKITNSLNGKMYIGQSRNCDNRISRHKRALFRKTHHNIFLQNSWNNHKEYFKFEVFYLCAMQDLNYSEKYFIKVFKTFYKDGNGYNLTEGGSCENPEFFNNLSKLGKNRKHSDSVRKKISESQRGKIISVEQRLQISKTLTGKCIGIKRTQETRNKMSIAQLGHVCSIESKLKLSNAAKKRNKCTYDNIKRKVIQLDINDNFIREWDSVKSAAIGIGIKCSSDIGACIRGRYKQIKGYHWKYA